MSNTIRSIRNLAPYLLPTALLATVGILLMGLLYYPVPSTSATHAPQSLAITGQEYRRSHAENMLAAMLADAMRQLHTERQTQTRDLRYPHGESAPSGELPLGQPWIAPLIIERGGDPNRPVLIRL